MSQDRLQALNAKAEKRTKKTLGPAVAVECGAGHSFYKERGTNSVCPFCLRNALLTDYADWVYTAEIELDLNKRALARMEYNIVKSFLNNAKVRYEKLRGKHGG